MVAQLRRLAALAAVIGLVAASGCGSDEEEPSPAGRSGEPTSTPTPDEPTGAY